MKEITHFIDNENELDLDEIKNPLTINFTVFNLGKISNKYEKIEEFFDLFLDSDLSSSTEIDLKQKEENLKTIGIDFKNSDELIFDVKQFVENISVDNLYQISLDTYFISSEIGAIVLIYLMEHNPDNKYQNFIENMLGYSDQNTQDVLNILEKRIQLKNLLDTEFPLLGEFQKKRFPLDTEMSYDELRKIYDLVSNSDLVNSFALIVYEKINADVLKSYLDMHQKLRPGSSYPGFSEISKRINLGITPEIIENIYKDFDAQIFFDNIEDIYTVHILYGEEKYQKLVTTYLSYLKKYNGKSFGFFNTILSLSILDIEGKISTQILDEYFEHIGKSNDLGTFMGSGLDKGIPYQKFKEYDKKKYKKRFGKDLPYLIYGGIEPSVAFSYDERFVIIAAIRVT